MDTALKFNVIIDAFESYGREVWSLEIGYDITGFEVISEFPLTDMRNEWYGIFKFDLTYTKIKMLSTCKQLIELEGEVNLIVTYGNKVARKEKVCLSVKVI